MHVGPAGICGWRGQSEQRVGLVGVDHHQGGPGVQRSARRERCVSGPCAKQLGGGSVLEGKQVGASLSELLLCTSDEHGLGGLQGGPEVTTVQGGPPRVVGLEQRQDLLGGLQCGGDPSRGQGLRGGLRLSARTATHANQPDAGVEKTGTLHAHSPS